MRQIKSEGGTYVQQTFVTASTEPHRWRDALGRRAEPKLPK
nr:MAG TPA: hypothetical protein [Caudoviricetes sp.]DAU48219.1 MAG TPA: hypothetical protein [Bacteriophage sp.]